MKWLPRWEGNLCLEIQEQAVSCVHAVFENVVGMPHYHRGLEILYCLSGNGTFYFGNQSIPYNAPALLFFNGLIPHTAHMEGRYERWNIWIETSSFEQAVQSNMPPLAKQLITVSEIAVGTVPAELTNILSSTCESVAYELKNRSPFYEEIVYYQLLTIMLIAERLVDIQHKRHNSLGMEGPLNKSRTLEQLYLFNYIDANLADDLSAKGPCLVKWCKNVTPNIDRATLHAPISMSLYS